MWTESTLLHLRQHFDILNDQKKLTKILYTFSSLRVKTRTRDVLSTVEHYHTLDHAGYYLLYERKKQM
jgi:hypothetical protein